MRISTLQFTQNAINSISRQQVELSRIQSQIASGKNILTPSDDPAGAGRILTLNQSLQTTNQFTDNANLAQGRLQLEESTLASVTNAIQRIRELSIQANNDTQNSTTRPLIAAEISQRRDELLALANTRDANGEYIFSGFQSQNEAYTRNPDNTFSYNGDEGQRYLQVGPSRQVAVGDSGREVFGLVRNGNGTFATSDVAGNTGSGVIGPGSVVDRSALTGNPYTINFANNTAGDLVYSVFETSTPPVPAVQNDSVVSGTFTPFIPGVGEEFSLTVGNVQVLSLVGDGTTVVTAATVDNAITAATPALTAAGISSSGTAGAGDLIFSRTDGVAFDITTVNDAATGGFAGGDFAIGTNTVNNGSVATANSPSAPAVQNDSLAPGAFASFTPGAGDTYSIAVNGVQVFSQTGGGLITATEIDTAFTNAAAALTAAGVTVSGSVIGGDLVVSRADGAAFGVDVVDDAGTGGFVGGQFQIGVNVVNNGSESVLIQNDAATPGAFTTFTPGGTDTYSITVGSVPVFTQTGGLPISATEIDNAFAAQAGALTTAGFTVNGSVAGGDLAISRVDGVAFDITIVDDAGTGGFDGADLQTGTSAVNNGTPANPAVQNDSNASGAFTDFTPGGGQTYSLTVDGVSIFTQTGGGLIDVATIQGAIDGAAAALATAGISVGGTVAGGDIVFSRVDGVSFDIVVADDAGTGGFAGADFQLGTNTINNGSPATPASQNDSRVPGAFETFTPGATDDYSITVDGVAVFSQTGGAAISATEIDNAVLTATAALNGAGITVSGTAANGDLVFSRVDGTTFNIDVVNDAATGGFNGGDFVAGTQTVDNGGPTIAVQNNSVIPGAFETFTPGALDNFNITVDGVQVFDQTGGGAIDALAIDAAVFAATTALNAAGVTTSGSAANGDLTFSRADGASFNIAVVNTAGIGGFRGGDFEPGTQVVNNGSTVVTGGQTQLIPTPPADPVTAGIVFNPGASISFDGLQVSLTGTPAGGDAFTISPSVNQDIFTTTQNLIEALETSTDSLTERTAFHNSINRVLGNIDQAFNNVNEVRAQVGSRLNLIENQLNLNEAATLQAQTTLSSIEDLDFAEAVSRLQLQTTSLQAAQQSFLRIQGLSLFNFLN